MPSSTPKEGPAIGVAIGACLLVIASIKFAPLGVGLCFIEALILYFRAINDHQLSGAGSTAKPTPPEPAFRQYFFDKAFDDFWLTVKQPFAVLDLSWKQGKSALETVVPKSWQVVYLGVSLLAGFWTLVMSLILAAFGVIHFAVLCVVALLMLALAMVFQLAEHLNLTVRRVFIACPHGGCYRKIRLPVYQCPHCGAEHKRLIPGSYGVFQRRCQCGNHLPTLFLLGRHNLPSRCPHPNCGRPLPGLAPIRTYHFPIIGGASAGKSTFLMAIMSELQNLKVSGLRCEPIGAEREKDLTAARLAFAQGLVLAKTSELTPNAFVARFSSASPSLLYFYDAAGELFHGSDALFLHQHLEFASGLLFLIDPFSIQQMQENLQREFAGLAPGIRPSEEDPALVYSRFISAMRSLTGKDRFSTLPIAVILTKSDAAPLFPSLPPYSAPPETQNRAVRQWLITHGQTNLVTLFEQDFLRVHYFHVSALGRVPDTGAGAFQPKGVLAPVQWLFKSNGVELRPQAAGTNA
jgi:hypothetical protein